MLTTVLERSGVDVRTGAAVQRVSAGPTLHLDDGTSVTGTNLLVAVGRKPATKGMGLKEVGLELGKQGQVVTDEYLRTSVECVREGKTISELAREALEDRIATSR